MKSEKAHLSKDRRDKIIQQVLVYWKRILFAALCMVVVAGANGGMALLVKPVLDDIFIARDSHKLLIIPGACRSGFFFKRCRLLRICIPDELCGGAHYPVFRDSLYEKITELPISFIHEEKTGTLMSRITNDVNIVKGMVSTAVVSLFRDSFSVVAFLFVIFYRDWKLALGAFIVLPVAFYPIVIFGRRIRRFSTGSQETMADMTAFLHETFTGAKIIKIFNLREFEVARFKEKTNELFRLEMKKVKTRALSSPVMEFLGGLGIAFIIWFGGMRVVNGTSTPGVFFSFLTAVMMLYEPVEKALLPE